MAAGSIIKQASYKALKWALEVVLAVKNVSFDRAYSRN